MHLFIKGIAGMLAISIKPERFIQIVKGYCSRVESVRIGSKRSRVATNQTIPFPSSSLNQRRGKFLLTLTHRSEGKELARTSTMNSAGRRSGGGLFEGLYRVIMRRNSVYVTFIIAGAFLGERVMLWTSFFILIYVCCFFLYFFLVDCGFVNFVFRTQSEDLVFANHWILILNFVAVLSLIHGKSSTK